MSVDRDDIFIQSLGFEAYRVGGSVRDDILGRKAKDADYMVRRVSLDRVGSRLFEVEGKFPTPMRDRRNQQFGWRSSKGVEIALPRREENAGAGRAQTIVVDPSITLEEDARRRDFTFNALYKIISHPDGLATSVTAPDGSAIENIIDPTGRGLHDLQRGLIQTTHADSFRDDPLRTLRALRFVSRGFTLGIAALEQMETHAAAVDGLTSNGYASGTILDEMSKILMGDRVRYALRIARDTGVLGTLFPELAPMLGHEPGSRYHDLTTCEHSFKALAVAARVGAPLRVRWALLFHDSGKPEVEWVGDDGFKHFYATWIPTHYGNVGTEDHEVASERRWRGAAERIGADRRLREDVATLVRNHMVPLSGRFRASKVRQGRVKFGDDMLRDLYMHRACDISGKGRTDKNALARLARMEMARAEAQRDGIPASVRDLAVNGEDAKAAGLAGAEIGDALRGILHEVVSQPNERTLDREWQLQRLAGA